MAKPRVFVSSTYYDLKYARERLERFIKSYNMEPVLFESDEVYFNPNRKIDKSCYTEVETCHLMLLIVGGRYGSLASNSELDKEKYDNDYVSITQKEYQTANNINIPVIICVDRNVYADYETYLMNKDKKPDQIKYAHTDNCKIFEFIDTLQKSAIKLFNKIEDIEHFFSNQISGMLFTYLDNLKRESHEIELKSTLEQIQQVSKSMSSMLNEVALKVFENEKGKYDTLILEQRKSLIDFFITIFKQNCILQKITNEETETNTKAEDVYRVLMDTIFNTSKIKEITQTQSIFGQMVNNGKIVSECAEQMIKLGCEFKITRIEYREAFAQISEFITDNKSDLSIYFQDKLMQMIKQKLAPRISFGLARNSIAKNKHM